YAEESANDHTGSNPYQITVTLSHEAAPTATASSTDPKSDAEGKATGNFGVTASEGKDTGMQTVATFTDPGGVESTSDYSASINWGDGSAASSGVISVSGGVYTVQGSHTYAEESAADHTGSNPYQITVTISHEGAPTATASSTATVSDPAVVATGNFVVTASEGASSGLLTVATCTDPGGAEVSVPTRRSSDLGDGTAASTGVISVSGGVYTVQGSHTYAEES